MSLQNHYSLKPLGLLLLIFFLSACSKKPEGSVYFPLQKGLSWTYKVTTEYPDESHENELTITSLGKRSFDDKTYFIRRTSSGIDYYINHDEQGVYREGLRTMVKLKPSLDSEKRYILKFPLEIGTNWDEISRPMVLLRISPIREKIREGHYNVPMSYRIASLSSTVTVPAGSFENCIKVIAEGILGIYTDAMHGEREVPITTEEWYAPGVGLVKQVRYELDGESISSISPNSATLTPIIFGGHTRLELQSFNN